jgi:hypothetical protein
MLTMEAAIQHRIEVFANSEARGWLEEHPEVSRLFLSFMSSRACCSGARVCDVRVRVNADASRGSGAGATWTSLGRVDGREVFIDTRLIERMPAHARLMVRGVGPFRRLDLDLTGEEWAELLYPSPH